MKRREKKITAVTGQSFAFGVSGLVVEGELYHSFLHAATSSLWFLVSTLGTPLKVPKFFDVGASRNSTTPNPLTELYHITTTISELVE